MDNVGREAGTAEVSVIGAGISVVGNIEASVDLQIQGKVNGDVRCATLLLGEGSEIRGNVVARRVRVAGMVEGSIETGDLAIEASARVTGDVTYSRIRIANGAVVHGQMRHSGVEEDNVPVERPRLVEAQAAPRQAMAQGHGRAQAQAQAVYIE
jgi:cytoskeletal protein CcmA (bactofilin family)